MFSIQITDKGLVSKYKKNPHKLIRKRKQHCSKIEERQEQIFTRKGDPNDQ